MFRSPESPGPPPYRRALHNEPVSHGKPVCERGYTTLRKLNQTFIDRTPTRLVENRVSFAGPNAEFSIYDTYLPARDVRLDAGELLFCGMLTGRKVLHGSDGFETEFLPSESFVMSPGETIRIDFPDAELERPTTCLTIEISQQRIDQICDRLNQQAPLHRDFDEWRFHQQTRIHAEHSAATQALLERLAGTFVESGGERDLLIDFGISELVVRMLRHQTRALLLAYAHHSPDGNGLSAAIDHLERHLEQPLDIEYLRRLACMSRSRFFSEFRKHLACSPAEFQHQLRLDRATLMLQRGMPATAVCYELGYGDPSHFSRRFHQRFGVSPRVYQQRHRAGQQHPEQ